MIEHLDGIYETVTFQKNLGLRINNNTIHEDFPAHWHTPMEIIWCTANEYRIAVGDEEFFLREGDIAFIRPGVIHALFSPAHGSRVICLADLTFLPKISNLETLLALLAPVTLITARENGALHEEITRLLKEIQEEYEGAHSFYEMLIYAMVMKMLALLGKNSVRLNVHPDIAAARPSKYAARLLQVCGYINAHCTEDLTLDQIADLAGFSKYHFTRLFKAFTHTTFYKYLNQKRIAHAEKLLTNPDYSVTEVALHSGFSSLSAFIRMFRQIKGCTPTKFRSMYSPNSAIHLFSL